MLVLVSPVRASPNRPPASSTVRAYAKQLAARAPYFWSGSEWAALDAIVQPESGWDPCAYFPQRHDCAYGGSNSCGIPQANPCPRAWRGRLGASWREQVQYLLRYVRDRVGYGSPSRALVFRRANGWY